MEAIQNKPFYRHKVKDVVAMLQNLDPEAEVFIEIPSSMAMNVALLHALFEEGLFSLKITELQQTTYVYEQPVSSVHLEVIPTCVEDWNPHKHPVFLPYVKRLQRYVLKLQKEISKTDYVR